MLFILLFFAICAKKATAHVRLEYAPLNWPIRNAKTATADGTWSTAKDGCGGTSQYAKNGKTTVKAGQRVELLFNYGTGLNGDHKSSSNKWRVSFVCLDEQTQADFLKVENALVSGIDGAAGARPSKYTATVTIPNKKCDRAVLGMLDQRNWGACYDLVVEANVPNPTPRPPTPRPPTPAPPTPAPPTPAPPTPSPPTPVPATPAPPVGSVDPPTDPCLAASDCDTCAGMGGPGSQTCQWCSTTNKCESYSFDTSCLATIRTPVSCVAPAPSVTDPCKQKTESGCAVCNAFGSTDGKQGFVCKWCPVEGRNECMKYESTCGGSIRHADQCPSSNPYGPAPNSPNSPPETPAPEQRVQGQTGCSLCDCKEDGSCDDDLTCLSSATDQWCGSVTDEQVNDLDSAGALCLSAALAMLAFAQLL